MREAAPADLGTAVGGGAEAGLRDTAHVGVHVGEHEAAAGPKQGGGSAEKVRRRDVLQHQRGGDQVRGVEEAPTQHEFVVVGSGEEVPELERPGVSALSGRQGLPVGFAARARDGEHGRRSIQTHNGDPRVAEQERGGAAGTAAEVDEDGVRREGGKERGEEGAEELGGQWGEEVGGGVVGLCVVRTSDMGGGLELRKGREGTGTYFSPLVVGVYGWEVNGWWWSGGGHCRRS